jgi:CDP-diglyceride synthetase
LLANWYGTALILALIWATISGFLGQTKPNWRAVAIIWVVVACIVLWAVYRAKRSHVRELTELNATLPDQVSLTNDGVKCDGPNGATGFLPWRTFKGWREGRRVVLVDQCQGNRVVMLPVSQLSEVERVTIRQFLQSHIAPESQ